MRLCARRFRGFLLSVALVIGGAAVAQELQFDPKALDTSGAGASVSTKRGKGRKAAPGAEAAPPHGAGKPAAQQAGGNRQFGELEGWSPGKTPPKPKDKDDGPSQAKPPVTVSPNGNMGTGFAF